MDSHFIDGHPILPSHLLLPRWIELSFGPTAQGAPKSVRTKI